MGLSAALRLGRLAVDAVHHAVEEVVAMFNNLKIGARLGLGFGMLLALLTVTAGVAAWQIGRLADVSATYAVDLVPSAQAQNEIALSPASIRRYENRHILMETDAAMDEVEAKIEVSRKSIAADLDKYARELVSDEGDRQAMNKVKDALDAYYPEWERFARSRARK